jgi:hypothetical protein
MSRNTAYAAGALVSLLAVVAGPAVAQTMVGDEHPEPVTRLEATARVAIPCDQAITTIELDVGEFLNYSGTTEGDGVVPGYGCRTWNEGGPEHIYLLEVSEPMAVDIWLTDNEPDHDLILLSDCDSDSCLVQANTQISVDELAAGSYVLVVDGYVFEPNNAPPDTARGPYELIIESRAVGVPEEICAPDGAQDLGEFSGDGPDQEFLANLFDRPNLVSIYDCAPVALRGGEAWYAATLAASDTTYDDGTDIGSTLLEVTVAADSLDIAVWIFDGCGPDAVCLTFVDDGPTGTEEVASWLNSAHEPVTIYLAVDSLVPAERETQGEVEILFGDVVPVESRSLSDIRGLFR